MAATKWVMCNTAYWNVVQPSMLLWLSFFGQHQEILEKVWLFLCLEGSAHLKMFTLINQLFQSAKNSRFIASPGFHTLAASPPPPAWRLGSVACPWLKSMSYGFHRCSIKMSTDCSEIFTKSLLIHCCDRKAGNCTGTTLGSHTVSTRTQPGTFCAVKPRHWLY